MSFLGSIVDSIGTGKAPPAKSQGSNTPAAGIARTKSPALKAAVQSGVNPQASTLKRKADENGPASLNKIVKPYQTNPAVPVTKQPVPLAKPTPTLPSKAPNAVGPTKLARDGTSKAPTNATVASSKPPPSKGSFADLMARAQAQGTQPQNFGIIKHTKTAPKENVSRREQERRKQDAESRANKSGSGAIAKPDKDRKGSPAKNGVQDGRVTKAAPARPTYKGTLGMASGRTQSRPEKKSRYDDYLGTDEEDNSDIADEEDGYESSDMEGGFDDLELEEQKALRVAKQDDARELAEENRLKREKEERRRRLTALANKRK